MIKIQTHMAEEPAAAPFKLKKDQSMCVARRASVLEGKQYQS